MSELKKKKQTTNGTTRYRTKATKNTSLQQMADRLGIDSTLLLEWNPGAENGFKAGDVINLNLTNDLGKALMKSVNALKTENQRRTAAQLAYIDENRSALRGMAFMNGEILDPLTVGVDLNKMYAGIINDTDAGEDANDLALKQWKSEQATTRELLHHDNNYSFTKSDGSIGYLPNNEHRKNFDKYKLSNPKATVDEYLQKSGLWDSRDGIAANADARYQGYSRDEANFRGLVGSDDKEYYNANDYDLYRSDVHLSLQNTKTVGETGAKMVAAGMLGGSAALLPGVGTLASGINTVLSSSPVLLGLGAYGAYDSVSDMYHNGVNLGNSLELAGSVIPYLKYAKNYTPLGREISDIIKYSDSAQWFNANNVERDAQILAQAQKIMPATNAEKAALIARYRLPQMGKAIINGTLDTAAGIAGSHLSNNVNEGIDATWDYTTDENGNIDESINNQAKDVVKNIVSTAGFVGGYGARAGNTLRGLTTGTLAFGPGSQLVHKGFQTTEDAFDIKDNFLWKNARQVGEFVIPALLHKGLSSAVTKGKLAIGQNLNQEDLVNMNTTFKDAAIDATILLGIATPVAHVVSSMLPDDMSNKDDITSYLAYTIGGKANPRQLLSRAFLSTAGAQLYTPKTIARTIEHMLAEPLTTFTYTGRYTNNDRYMKGSLKEGSAFGVEGTGIGYRKHVGFNKYDQSGYRNFAERRSDAPEINWWNIHTGEYIPSVGERFGRDSRVVRYDKNKIGSDYASNITRDVDRPIAEIRTNSRLLGEQNVPEHWRANLSFGISRSDEYFTGPSKEALNTVGANGVLYRDINTGKLSGILVVDYTNPGVRRISPSNTWHGKVSRWLAHPFNSKKRNANDNYYNNQSLGSIADDLKYLTTSWATSAAEGMQRALVVNTTGAKAFSEITPESYNQGFRELIWNPNGEHSFSPSVTEITKWAKGTPLEKEVFGKQLEGFINEVNAHEGSSMGLKFDRYMRFSSPTYLKKVSDKQQKEQQKRQEAQKKIDEKNEEIMEKWFSYKDVEKGLTTTKKKPFFRRMFSSQKVEPVVDKIKIEKVFNPSGVTRVKDYHFYGLPENIRNYILDNYKYELYKQGGKLGINQFGI